MHREVGRTKAGDGDQSQGTFGEEHLKQGRHMASGRLKQEIFKQGDQGYSMEARMAMVSSEDLCPSIQGKDAVK